MGNFSMVGKLSMPKATEKFSPYAELESRKGTGWVSRRLRFNVACSENRHMLSIDAGCFKDGHGVVYTYSTAAYDASGSKIKDGETIQIPFKDRLKPANVSKVAAFRKFYVDLEPRNVRNIRRSVRQKLDNGEPLSGDELETLGIQSQDEAKERIELAEKRRKEWISSWDFCEYVKKLIQSGKYAGKKFYVSGQREFQYNAEKQIVYESLVPTKIYIEDDDAEEYAKEDIEMYYGKDSLDVLSEDDTGKIYVNGWERTYERSLKKRIFVKRTITILLDVENGKKKSNALKKRFSVEGEDTIMCRNVEADLIDGSPLVEITPEMLTDEQREDLELGLITEADIRREFGSDVRGERVKEFRFAKFSRARKTAEETTYTKDDMVITVDADEKLFDDQIDEGLPFDDDDNGNPDDDIL